MSRSFVQQSSYVNKVIITANRGNAFTLQEIFTFQWDEAILMAGEANDGAAAREHYNSNYKIRPALNDTDAVLAFFKNGICVDSMRFNRYSDFSFVGTDFIITPEMEFEPIKKSKDSTYELVLKNFDEIV